MRYVRFRWNLPGKSQAHTRRILKDTRRNHELICKTRGSFVSRRGHIIYNCNGDSVVYN
jgi:hypothetical protein